MVEREVIYFFFLLVNFFANWGGGGGGGDRSPLFPARHTKIYQTVSSFDLLYCEIKSSRAPVHGVSRNRR